MKILLIHPPYSPQAIAFLNEIGLACRSDFVIVPGATLYAQLKSKMNKNYDYFNFGHAVGPPRLGEPEFFRQFMTLYDTAYSFKRYIGTVFYNLWWRFIKRVIPGNLERHIPLAELLKLRIAGIILQYRLRRIILPISPDACNVYF